MTIERIIDYAFTAALVIVTAVLVWRHQNKPEASDGAESEKREP
jgi:hypothetical protein